MQCAQFTYLTAAEKDFLKNLSDLRSELADFSLRIRTEKFLLEHRLSQKHERPDTEPWNGTDDGDNDEDDRDHESIGPIAQEVPPTLPFLGESPELFRPPFEDFPQDPTVSPGPGWEWRGTGDPGTKGNWINKNTGEKLNPDLDHKPPVGPHWDYTDPEQNEFRWYPDGRFEPKDPKIIVGEEIT